MKYHFKAYEFINLQAFEFFKIIDEILNISKLETPTNINKKTYFQCPIKHMFVQ